jgi:carbamate kinase
MALGLGGVLIMNKAVVIIVNGEVLADRHDSTIASQRNNARLLAEGLVPLLTKDVRLLLLHGNKPQVGFVLQRSELASHALHPIPLDICGADTQGATGYMLAQAVRNVLADLHINRDVMAIVTQTVVDDQDPLFNEPTKAIGPYYDRQMAERHRQLRGWNMLLEPGRGYRRAVPAPTPLEIVEMEGIAQLTKNGSIVIAGGGGGIPVIRTPEGYFQGVEAVVDTDQVAYMMARNIKASMMLMVIESDDKFASSRLSTERGNHLSLPELEAMLAAESFGSNMVRAKLLAAARFLQNGGEQVIITTLRKLPLALSDEVGLRIGAKGSSVELVA